MTPQQEGALILRAQLDAKRLNDLARASNVVTLAPEDAREIGERMRQVAAIAEEAHLGTYAGVRSTRG